MKALSRILVTTAVLLAVAAPARADDDKPQIVVHGSASLVVPPDQAFVTLAVEARNAVPGKAQAAGSKAAAAVMAGLSGADLPEDAIRTLSYSLNEQFDWEKGKRIPRGYLSRNVIEVRIDEVKRVGEILGLVVDQGATSVVGLRFDIRDRTSVEQQALREAVENARGFAAAAAQGAGARLGGILRIEQSGSISPSPRRMRAGAMMMAESKSSAPPIEAGEIEIRASAELTFAID